MQPHSITQGQKDGQVRTITFLIWGRSANTSTAKNTMENTWDVVGRREAKHTAAKMAAFREMEFDTLLEKEVLNTENTNLKSVHWKEGLCPKMFTLCPKTFTLCPKTFTLCPKTFILCPKTFILCPKIYTLICT